MKYLDESGTRRLVDYIKEVQEAQESDLKLLTELAGRLNGVDLNSMLERISDLEAAQVVGIVSEVVWSDQVSFSKTESIYQSRAVIPNVLKIGERYDVKIGGQKYRNVLCREMGGPSYLILSDYPESDTITSAYVGSWSIYGASDPGAKLTIATHQETSKEQVTIYKRTLKKLSSDYIEQNEHD